VASNDPMQDNQAFNAPGMGSTEFDSMSFDEIEVTDLFWLKEQRGDNQVYRKITEQVGQNLRTGEEIVFDRRLIVFQKT
tara:strand:- start:1218 stop:1454 length:237 start_codon:yes stop_codon:yes gene_type:complete